MQKNLAEKLYAFYHLSVCFLVLSDNDKEKIDLVWEKAKQLLPLLFAPIMKENIFYNDNGEYLNRYDFLKDTERRIILRELPILFFESQDAEKFFYDISRQLTYFSEPLIKALSKNENNIFFNYLFQRSCEFFINGLSLCLHKEERKYLFSYKESGHFKIFYLKNLFFYMMTHSNGFDKLLSISKKGNNKFASESTRSLGGFFYQKASKCS